MEPGRVLDVLDAVLESTVAERPARLRELCEDDADLRQEVERLLALEDDVDGFLDAPAVDLGVEETAERLGPYHLLDVLGQGGMGTVYHAVRENDFQKQVALKVLRREIVSASMVERFHDERQILARLEHPGIARLLDGGALPDGRPYLVMEHVEGVPIDRFCAERSLGVRARLVLFRKVAEAVAFAHQNLVVHRDIKPGNVLVTSGGIPKLLDFGIAKLLDPAAKPAASLRAAPEPMTPRFASPEQVAGGMATPASDVYALGLLLYEMLTGTLPCGLKDCPPEDVPRRIREEEPEPPSQMARGVPPDVDAIVLKALRKEPDERYVSAKQLASDVGRHLRSLPVRARRSTWHYVLGKLLRRRPWTAAAVTLFVAFSVTSTFLWREAVGERRRADEERIVALREQARAERVSSFLKDLFRSADPDAVRQKTVREVLTEGRARLAEGLEDEPELEAELAGTLGDVYRNLGLYEEAVELLQRSVDLRRKIYPEGHLRLAVALNDLGSVLYYMERYAEAEACLRESLAMRRRLGEEPLAIAQALNNLASVLKQKGELAAAGELYEEALKIRQAVDGQDGTAVASSLYSLGALRFAEGDLEAAEPLLRRALEIYTVAYGEKNTRVASVLSTLGRLLHQKGEQSEAADVLRRSLAVRRELLGEDDARVASTWADLEAVLASE